MPCAKSQLVARYDKDGKLIGVKLRPCSGLCSDGQSRCTETGRPDPDDADNTINFCACPEDIIPHPLSRDGLVSRCRVAVLRDKNRKPIDFICIGFCEDDDKTECRPVVVEKIELAKGGSQHVIECRCIEKVETVGKISRSKKRVGSRRRKA